VTLIEIHKKIFSEINFQEVSAVFSFFINNFWHKYEELTEI